MDDIVKKIYQAVKFQCRPNKDRNDFEVAFESFFGTNQSNFVGGQNDKRNTLHENIFQIMFPSFESQVTFGTGKGGYDKYLSKKYTVDFFDKENGIIYEIDGKNHATEIGILKDRIRDCFFMNELGYKTVRITNKEVERMLISRIKTLKQAGVLNGIYD